ncbi:hypothetical protein C7E18_22260, partial [Stenotrophomonas maltophilia]
RSLKAELAWALPKLADSRDRALLEALCFAVLRRRTGPARRHLTLAIHRWWRRWWTSARCDDVRPGVVH